MEEANGGTLFLDEVGELKRPTEAALLRFLQEREFQRVGGTPWTGRGDLTPTVREMRQDSPRLVEHFIQTRRHICVVKGISPEALECMVRYDWPGNVRQLQNAIDHALVIHSSEFIQLKYLPMVVTKESNVEASESSLESDVLQTRKTSVERAVQETRSNPKAAAALLGISTRHLRRLIRELNVKML